MDYKTDGVLVTDKTRNPNVWKIILDGPDYEILKEKAKKWDRHIQSGVKPAIWIDPDKFNELEEKAKRWDECGDNPYYPARIDNKDIFEWKDIAKSNEEKAKKYDEIKNILGDYEI